MRFFADHLQISARTCYKFSLLCSFLHQTQVVLWLSVDWSAIENKLTAVVCPYLRDGEITHVANAVYVKKIGNATFGYPQCVQVVNIEKKSQAHRKHDLLRRGVTGVLIFG